MLKNCFEDKFIFLNFAVCCLSENDMQAIFNSMDDADAIFEFDLNDLVEYSTAALEAFFGMKEEKLTRVTKIGAFENEVNQLLQHKTSNVDVIMPLKETAATRDTPNSVWG